MSIALATEQRDGYAVVRIGGDPTLDEFLSGVVQLGTESKAWPARRGLFDLREVCTLKSFTDQYAIGEAVARYLGHLHRIASVVPVDRITHASEKTARRDGVTITVFTSEGDAIAWLTSDLP